MPEPIIEQPSVTLDHMTSAMSMILCEQDLFSQDINFSDIELLQNEDIMSNLFYEYKDILENERASPSQNSIPGKITKSLSSDSLITVDGAQMRPSYENFTEMGMTNVHGMKRVSTEGYIKV